MVATFAGMSDSDLCAAAHTAAVEHYNRCERALYDDWPDDDEPVPESPAIAPYCGCDDCVVREILHAGFEFLLELTRRHAAAAAP